MQLAPRAATERQRTAWGQVRLEAGGRLGVLPPSFGSFLQQQTISVAASFSWGL